MYQLKEYAGYDDVAELRVGGYADVWICKWLYRGESRNTDRQASVQVTEWIRPSKCNPTNAAGHDEDTFVIERTT